MPYLFETHYHTPESSPCGNVEPADALPKYQQAGYSGVVVTDHFFKKILDSYGEIPWADKVERWLSGYRAALKAAPEGFVVLLGMELRFPDNENDHLVYGFDESFLKNHTPFYEMGFEGFHRFAREHHLFLAQAHPFRSVCTPRDPACLDGVEVYNGNVRWNSHNDRARKLAAEYGLTMLSGSDFHEWEDLCRGGVELSQCPRTSAEFASFIRQGKITGLREFPMPSVWKRKKAKWFWGNRK